MARTINEIQAAIAATRAANSDLDGLNSPSATAIYRLIEYVMAVCQWAHETIWDRFRADVDAVIARAPVGTPAWFADQLLLFQEGDPLAVLPSGRLGYAPGSTGAKIVTRATAKENAQTGRLFLKVATDGAAPGTLAPLTPEQLVQVQGYVSQFKPAGVRTEVVSRAADKLRMHAEIFYDPLLPVAAVKAAVIASISSYLARLDFDGQVYVARLEDAIQAVAGVKDLKIVSVLVRVGAVDTAVDRVYETQAGYVEPEDAPGYTLSDFLLFTPFN